MTELLVAGLLALLGSSGDPLVSAIEQLEAENDAKCHSTASRFEDFLFGTPLSGDARRAHVGLQKELVHGLWGRASARAARDGADTVDVAQLGPEIDQVVDLAPRPDGPLRARFANGTEVDLPDLRARQYASIAFSLRAILGVRQDFLVSGGPQLLELTPEALALLRETLDAISLSVLLLADRDAREGSDFEIGELTLRAAWTRLLPAGDDEQPGPSEAVAAPRPAEARARAFALLDQIVAAKGSAYRLYNERGSRDLTPLLVFNISRFYARRPLPPQRRERRRMVVVLESHLEEFAGRLLVDAAGRARAAGEPLIRAAHADAAVQQLLPQRIDSFEDVHVFYRLGGERVTLESFDCDSFRDFALHWAALRRAALGAPRASALPDPFAAEILAEAVSQYGVALLRVAGDLAGRDAHSAQLLEADLTSAATALRERAGRHHAVPDPPAPDTRLASAAGAVSAAADAASGGPFFRDVADRAGVAFVHRSSRWLGEFRHRQIKTPPTFSGGGVAAEDVDGDGHVDLLFVGGGGNALLQGDGRGAFRDVTEQAGLDWRRPDGSPGEARQPLVADFDNDGRQDVLVTYANDDHRLYRGLGGARFEDVTARAGLGGRGLVGGPATVFDFDGDGLLDVYVGYFGDYLQGAIPTFDRDNQNALPNRLFRNLGGLRFADVTEGSGADDRGWVQAISHVDFDRDGRQDLIVANDYGRNAFLRNLGGGRFENAAPALGLTQAFHSMNVGIADLNDDDHPDVYISNIATLIKDDKYIFPDVDTPIDFDLRAMAGMLVKESDVLYLSRLEQGRLVAYEPSTAVERGPTSTGWAWDAEFFDFDHDGDDDLYLVNGTNDYNVFSMFYRRFVPEGTDREYLLDYRRESNVFFVNAGGALRNRSAESGADFAENARSTAYLDFDGDGDLDVAINNFHGPARLLRNDAEKRGGWLAVRLVGDPARGSNRDAIGARLVVTTASGLRVRREVQGGSGYLSMNPKQQHVGLGAARTADVRVIWPNGEVQTLRGLAAGAAYTVRQGETGPSVAAGPRAVP